MKMFRFYNVVYFSILEYGIRAMGRYAVHSVCLAFLTHSTISSMRHLGVTHTDSISYSWAPSDMTRNGTRTSQYHYFDHHSYDL